MVVHSGRLRVLRRWFWFCRLIEDGRGRGGRCPQGVLEISAGALEQFVLYHFTWKMPMIPFQMRACARVCAFE